MIKKAKIEKNTRKKDDVIGRIVTGKEKGKIVFFNGTKPQIGQFVLLDEAEEKGKFLIAKKWRVQKEEERVLALRTLMDVKIQYSSIRGEFILNYRLKSSFLFFLNLLFQILLPIKFLTKIILSVFLRQC